MGNHLTKFISLTSCRKKRAVCTMLDLDLVTNAIEALHSNRLLDRKLGIRSEKDLEKYGIFYKAPADAKCTGLDHGSIDACISTNTLEHIPPKELEKIFSEIYRLLKTGGICSIKIDYSDHYSHTDQSISKLNFLRYSQIEWERFNHSNHYQNRLRHNDFLNLFRSLNFEIIEESFVNCEDPILFKPDNSFLETPNWKALSGNFMCKKTNVGMSQLYDCHWWDFVNDAHNYSLIPTNSRKAITKFFYASGNLGVSWLFIRR